MRVGFDVTSLCSGLPSGVATYTSNLFAHLVDLSRRSSGDDGNLLVPLAHRPVEDLPGGLYGRHLNKTLWMHLVLPGQLARRGVALCHFTNSVASLWTPCPTVVTIHDATLWLFPQHHYVRRLLTMRPFIPPAARRAAAIIAVSETTRRDIVRLFGVPADKVRVIYEAPAPCFRPLERKLVELVRQRYRLPPHFVLYVGTLEPRKNLVRLLKAFARVRKEAAVPHHLVLVGQRGWKSTPIFQAIQCLGLTKVVHVLGYVPTSDLVALYNAADVFVFPSVYEGFGLPVVEAMACGAPVLASRAGAIAEVAGEAAELVDPLCVEAMAAGLRRLLTDPAWRTELRQRGLARARAFSWSKAAEETWAVYREIA